VEHRVAGLYDEGRVGRPRTIGDEQITSLLKRTLTRKPVDGTHWTVRQAAHANGISKSTVHRVFQAFALPPHRARSFKLSTDPFFIEKVRDIVGLYLNPPAHALVLYVDEKEPDSSPEPDTARATLVNFQHEDLSQCSTAGFSFVARTVKDLGDVTGRRQAWLADL
jgi:hypothetical protein